VVLHRDRDFGALAKVSALETRTVEARAFFRASRAERPLRRERFASTYRMTSSGSVQAYCRSAQPMALRRKNSLESSEGSMTS